MPKSISIYRLFIKTILQLGVVNVFIVLVFRLLTKSRLLELLLPVGAAYRGAIFSSKLLSQPLEDWQFDKNKIIEDAEKLIKQHQITFFSRHVLSVGSPPSWFCNPFAGQCMKDVHRHFSRISDFNNSIGDIKTIWEASRFAWAPMLAQAFRLTGDPKYIDTINAWTEDWIQHNPYCIGPNWKCGQETSIRMLNILLAEHILGQEKSPSEVLIRFVDEHCKRIRPTIHYALAQDNNHGTSEAAGLFVGGAWLSNCSQKNQAMSSKAVRWREYGRKYLEERVQKLVEEDGSFSQKSLNYHRVLVDSLSLTEFWRRKYALSPFSGNLYEKAQKAVEWLFDMVDENSGDGPNLGANDGAQIMKLSLLAYRDYRASVQLGSVIFCDGTAYSNGPWNEPLFWLNLQKEIKSQNIFTKKSKMFDNGGYVILQDNRNKQKAWGMLSYPRFKTRPAHADIFHFDLWSNGENILRDSGTFSYAASESLQYYFSGTASHNTIQFDAHDQMPHLGRFLFGDWIKPSSVGTLVVSNEMQSWSGSYVDHDGCFHKRTVCLKDNIWEIDDEIEGYKKSAVLRWRLKPGDWHIEGSRCRCDNIMIEVSSDTCFNRLEVVEGLESRHYYEKNNIPVLEVEVAASRAKLKTRICLKVC